MDGRCRRHALLASYQSYTIGRTVEANSAPADFYPLCIEDDVDTSVRNVLG